MRGPHPYRRTRRGAPGVGTIRGFDGAGAGGELAEESSMRQRCGPTMWNSAVPSYFVLRARRPAVVGERSYRAGDGVEQASFRCEVHRITGIHGTQIAAVRKLRLRAPRARPALTGQPGTTRGRLCWPSTSPSTKPLRLALCTRSDDKMPSASDSSKASRSISDGFCVAKIAARCAGVRWLRLFGPRTEAL